jgi:hypothetical protein
MNIKYDSLTIDGKEKYRVKYVAVDDEIEFLENHVIPYLKSNLKIQLIKKALSNCIIRIKELKGER